MKKRIAILTIVVALVVVFAVVLSSCGIKNTIDNLVNGGSADNGVYPSADYDYTQIESNLNAMKQDGVFVKIRVTGEDEQGQADSYDLAYGAKGEIYFFQYADDADDQFWLDLSNNDYFVEYECRESENGTLVWTKEITHYNAQFTKESMKQIAEATVSGLWTYLGFYSSLTGEGTKTTATFLNRSCDKYIVKNGVVVLGASVGWTYECYIDKATGVCLKYTASAEANTADGHESASVSLEATEFNTAWVPRLPQASQTVIDDGEPQQGDVNPDGSQGGSGQQGGQVDGEGGASRPQGGGQVDGEGGASRPQGGQGEGGGQVIGGEGEGEEEQDRGPFIDKRLAVMAVNIPDNRALEQYFEGGYVQLYSSMDFECISDFGCLLGHFVSYHNATSGTAYLNAIKIYADGKYDYESAESMAEMELVFADGEYTLTFELYVEDTLTEIELTLEDAGAVQAHDNDVCPLDPNGYGIDPVYQVTQAEWDGIFKGDWLFEEIGNFTVDWDVASETWPHSGTFKVDYDYINDDDMMIYDRDSWEPDQDGLYDFHVYYYDSGSGNYSDMDIAQYDLADQWDDYTGAIPADFMKAGYNSVGHNYYINSFSYIPKGESSRISITNFRVWFSSNLITKIEYTRAGETLTFEFYDYNDTEVEVPNV